MSYEPGRRCEVCGGESPRVPVCGVCEVDAERCEELAAKDVRIAELEKELAEARSALIEAENSEQTAVAKLRQAYLELTGGAYDEIVRVKGELSAKDAEIARLKASVAEYVARLRDRARIQREGFGHPDKGMADGIATLNELHASEIEQALAANGGGE